jgi:ankyrin repeat protein
LLRDGTGRKRGARFAELFEPMVGFGCNVNEHAANGLTPLHSAILFNNLVATEMLLRHGADPRLTTRIDKGSDEIPIALEARAFALYLDEASGEDRRAIIRLLDDASGEN